MKSNLMELISQRLEQWKEKGIINVEEELDNIMKDVYFMDKVTYEDLKRSYVKDRLESVINANSFYSYKKNMFVTLENANIQELYAIDDNFANAIKAREKTLERIRAEERSRIEGQMVFTFKENIAVGAEQEMSLIDKLEDMT